ncbi:MAG: hypothetical protein A2Y10_05720 [Planctomycetes bacterium GWF2_41_51]|nr:MAG: hypothetical protein A2Y10_05720 [Planctomycetes bacterium GWF2_41_51]
MKAIFIFVVILTFSKVLFSDICDQDELQKFSLAHPEKIDVLFTALDHNYPGLEKVKSAWQQKDKVNACQELLNYYSTCNSGEWLRKKNINWMDMVNDTSSKVEEILKDVFTFQNVQGTVPRNAQGKLNWNYSPNNDFQWAMALNRHYHLILLADAYFKYNNLAYAKRINEDLRDWIISNPYSGKGQEYDATDKRQWSRIEAGCRAAIWPKVFYSLYDVLAPDVKILMLSSVPNYLHCVRNFHAKRGNQLTISLMGLAQMAAAFPEFKVSENLLDYSKKIMSESLMEQVYPDGVQKELSSHYHEVAFRNFYVFAEIYKHINKPLPVEFNERVNLMLDYMAYIQSPRGYGPMNNDSDYNYIRKLLGNVNETYYRNDWTYIITNENEGEKPKLLSVFYPWAGQTIMRNGWDANAHWAFFDVGPWGAGHRHADKLHLSISAYGQDLLIDSGRFTYVGFKGGQEYPWRDFFISSISHNVILIDGKGQKPKTGVVDQPLTNAFITNADYDFTRGEYIEGFADIEDNISHTRAVLYLRNRFWIVVDRINLEKPHQIQALWHYHPNCHVICEDKSATSIDKGQANLRIIPISSFDWNVAIVKGQEKPFIQGWYSSTSNIKLPNSTAVYTAELKNTQTFAWLLLVDPNDAPEIVDTKMSSDSSDKVCVDIKSTNNKGIKMIIPMIGNVSDASVTLHFPHYEYSGSGINLSRIR